ncbi:MAG: energy transducer TonB [Methylocystaceae bacterium]|nr:MAG: energy transducer TonB [Methylocystaceae bacterium]
MKRTALALVLCLCAGAGAAEEKQPEQAAAAPSGLSQSKFLGLLYSEIAKRTPAKNEFGPGSATASFHVDASGRIDKVTIDPSSSPKHAEIVRDILTGLQGPPPPGGSFDGSQKFNFH